MFFAKSVPFPSRLGSLFLFRNVFNVPFHHQRIKAMYLFESVVCDAWSPFTRCLWTKIIARIRISCMSLGPPYFSSSLLMSPVSSFFPVLLAGYFFKSKFHVRFLYLHYSVSYLWCVQFISSSFLIRSLWYWIWFFSSLHSFPRLHRKFILCLSCQCWCLAFIYIHKSLLIYVMSRFFFIWFCDIEFELSVPAFLNGFVEFVSSF